MSSCGTVRLVPGPMGAPGTDGTDGTNGSSAYTLLTAQFTMPAEQASAVATVADSTWMTPNQIVYLQGAGWLEVTAVPSSVTVTLKNLGDAATSAYLLNVAPGTILAVSNKLSAAGPQGPPGVDGVSGAPADATYITQTPNAGLSNEQALSALATGMMKVTTATGVISVGTDGTDYLSSTTGLTKAGNLAGIATPATARTNLGLGTIATQNANAVAITGGSVTGITDITVADGGTGASTAAGARANLGIGTPQAVVNTAIGYAATVADSFVLCDATLGPITISLPAVATSTNVRIGVKKIDASANAVTIDGNLGELIDGAATQVISAQWTAIDMICDGTAWFIV